MDMMQWIFIGLILVFLVFRFKPVKGITHITTQEAKAKSKEKNVQFVDVRTPGEYKARSSKIFKNIPLQQLAGRTSELDKEKEVVVICQSGMRSMQAAKLLKKQGFEKVTNVKGGMNAWN
ncbi:rhodanese-like domain-containing protein [Salirhabdus sp. Marseille-P4669]|uniref:rhodanese-like domain-containing protein n=1 Tax=Salirhabdus sp. Marseille-P4669 TaxID=2042310 RepID=UPI000C7C6F82|nr:rhodanese-like domain-containing protein [Salirhabdus sp. Marseille-P4669]